MTPTKKVEFRTPDYVKALLKPVSSKASSRKVWSIDIETVWLPFFTAGNTNGDTSVPADALGAPLRLAKDKDGTVRFAQNGRPVLRVAKDLSDQIRMVRENFEAGLVQYAVGVQKANPDGYKAQVMANLQAGIPINEKIVTDVDAAIALRAAEAEAPDETLSPVDQSPANETSPTETPVGESRERELVPA